MEIGGTGKDIGSGKNNTEIIIKRLEQNEETDKATQLCTNLNYNGYSDWYLPSEEELNLMYSNLFKRRPGKFSFYGIYWSSTELGKSWAEQIRFGF
jgi:hypothetical protein